MVSCQKGPTRHAYAWQIGPFWQDTLDIWKLHMAEAPHSTFTESAFHKDNLSTFYTTQYISMTVWETVASPVL